MIEILDMPGIDDKDHMKKILDFIHENADHIIPLIIFPLN